MRKVIHIPVQDVIPSAEAVLKAQGVPDDVVPDDRIVKMTHEAVSIYRTLSAPAGVVREVSDTEFATVYRGEGLNEVETPLDSICRSPDSLALFAVTVGERVCNEIARLFDVREFALASMLDAAASEGAEMAAGAAEAFYAQHLHDLDRLNSTSGTLRFSPGYCGWHISAQRKLFDLLVPGEIGISLGDSFLMQPLKSVSGVIIAGPKEIFAFDDDFPFCAECRTHSCRDRIHDVSRQ